MINTKMRNYSYSIINSKDEYGQTTYTPSFETIKMSISLISQSIGDNIKYKDATYIGLTKAYVDDTYVINYEGMGLKVLYVNGEGRYKQVFMSLI